jgi:hypothetical protein
MIAGDFDLAVGSLIPRARCRHSLSDVSLFADRAEGASGFAHLNVVALSDVGAPHWLASGTFSDKLSKCGAGCWRFDSRVLTVDGLHASQTMPTSEPTASLPVRS